MMLMLDISVVTHRGRVREYNEDTVGVAGWTFRGEEPAVIHTQATVFTEVTLLVADGLGGHVGGAEASATAVEAFFRTPGTIPERVSGADSAVHARAEADPRLTGLATTMAGVEVRHDGTITVFHVGDSRVYRSVDGFVALLTDDDAHADGTLTQVLGGAHRLRINPHLYEADLSTDTLLLCSDGLTAVLDEDVIAEALALPQRQAAERLLDSTLDGGAPDNVTFILCAAVQKPEH